MAEGGDAGDRTEAATPRRLQRAREQGQVPLSRELPSLAALAGLALVLMMAAPGAARELAGQLAVFLAQAHRFDTADQGGTALRLAGLAALRAAAPFLGVAVLAGAAATLLQTGFVLNPNALLPDLTRLSPGRGLARLFSLNHAVDALKAVAKVAVVGVALWRVLAADLPGLVAAPYWEPSTLADRLARETLHVLLTLVAAQAAIAGLDLLWVRVRHGRTLRMSRHDVREEMRESEGDPQIKARLRQLRRQRARRRLLPAIKAATVVVTNPSHYAVALSYDRTKNTAPRVVAKGVDEMAARIRALAEEHRVPMVANPPLARALYRVDLDTDIAPEHYKAVAELIAYVWRLQGRQRARRAVA